MTDDEIVALKQRIAEDYRTYPQRWATGTLQVTKVNPWRDRWPLIAVMAATFINSVAIIALEVRR